MSKRFRSVLLALVVGGLVVGAGCSALQGAEQSESRLLLVNQDETDHAVVVEIEDGSELVYSDGRTVEGESEVDLAAFDGSGEHEVTVTVDGTTTVIDYAFEDGDRVINIGIDNDGTVSME